MKRTVQSESECVVEEKRESKRGSERMKQSRNTIIPTFLKAVKDERRPLAWKSSYFP